MYDIIGDIHAHILQLKELLKKPGYSKAWNYYSHAERKAIFVGDLVNRDPEARKTGRLVRRMVENNAALFVPGNHVYSLLTCFTKISPGGFLLRHNSQNRTAFAATLRAYIGKEDELMDDSLWLRSQPLYLNMKNLRVYMPAGTKN